MRKECKWKKSLENASNIASFSHVGLVGRCSWGWGLWCLAEMLVSEEGWVPHWGSEETMQPHPHEHLLQSLLTQCCGSQPLSKCIPPFIESTGPSQWTSQVYVVTQVLVSLWIEWRALGAKAEEIHSKLASKTSFLSPGKVLVFPQHFPALIQWICDWPPSLPHGFLYSKRLMANSDLNS